MRRADFVSNERTSMTETYHIRQKRLTSVSPKMRQEREDKQIWVVGRRNTHFYKIDHNRNLLDGTSASELYLISSRNSCGGSHDFWQIKIIFASMAVILALDTLVIIKKLRYCWTPWTPCQCTRSRSPSEWFYSTQRKPKIQVVVSELRILLNLSRHLLISSCSIRPSQDRLRN